MRLTSLNEYINAERGNRFHAAGIKKKMQKELSVYIREAILKGELHRHEKPCSLIFMWTVPNKRRDLDNIAFATKFIQDALVANGVFQDDNLAHIVELHHSVKVFPKVFECRLTIVELI